MPFLAQTLAAIKEVPTAKTYATQVFELPEHRALDEVLDVWCSGTFCTDLDAVAAMRQKGRIFWCYPNFVACSRGVPNSARLTYGFEARLAAAKKAGKSAGVAVAAGEALLAEIRAAVPVRSTYEQDGPWRGPEYQLFRRRLAAAILALP